MKRVWNWFVGLLMGVLLHGAACGQTLDKILESIQDRQIAVSQRDRLYSDLLGSASTELPDITLIDWEEVGNNPTAGAVAELPIEQKICLVNQAIVELERLTPYYLNVRPEDLAVENVSLGTLRGYELHDFPVLPRANEQNYQSLITEIAFRLRRLRVLVWPYTYEGARVKTFKSEVVDAGDTPSSTGSWETEEVDGASTAALIAWYPSYDFTQMGMQFYIQDWCSMVDVESAPSPDPQDPQVRYKFQLSYHKQVNVKARAAEDATSGLPGTMYVFRRVNWTPMAATLTVPSDWQSNDRAWKLLGSSGGGSVDLNAASPSVDFTWIDDHPLLPSGYSNVNGSHYKHLGGTFDYFGRFMFVVCTPEFTKGVDDPMVGAKLDKTEEFISLGRKASGEVVLQPGGDLLYGIDLGVGVSGKGKGMLGVGLEGSVSEANSLIYNRSASPGVNVLTGHRFDYVSRLSMVGPVQDFHVVYETRMDQRGVSLPVMGRHVNGTWYDVDSMFLNWDAPRVRQVVGRDLVADISYQGHYAQTVKIYRRVDATAIDLDPGELMDVAGLELIRELEVKNPDVTTDYPLSPEKIVITDEDREEKYEVYRDKLAIGHDTLTFKISKNDVETYRKEIFNGAADESVDPIVPDAASTVKEYVNDVLVGTSTMSQEWRWWLPKAPVTTTYSAGEKSVTYTSTFETEPTAATQYGRYPVTTQVTDPDGGDATMVTWGSNGLLASVVRGKWSSETTVVEGKVRTVSEFDHKAYATQWTEFLDGGNRVKMHSAPDGNVNSIGTATDSTEVEYGDGTSDSLIGLPRFIRNKNEIGSKYSYELVEGNYKIKVEAGKLSSGGSSVQNGSRTESILDPRGYPISEKTFFKLGGEAQVSGKEYSQPNAWGAPTKVTDYATGLTTTWAYTDPSERLGSIMAPYNVETKFNAYDALGRVTSYTWNGHTGSRNFSYSAQDGFQIANTLQIPGRNHGSNAKIDALGRPVSGTSTTGGTSGWNITRNAAQVVTNTTDGVTGATSATEMSRDDGSLESLTGNTQAFGGTKEDALEVVNGLFKSKVKLDGQANTYRTTYTDAWGRVRKVEEPSTSGSGSDDTTYVYSDPGDSTQQVKVTDAAGREFVTEVDLNDASGIVKRSGINLNGGNLTSADRMVESVTSIDDGSVRTVVRATERNGLREVMRTYVHPQGSSVTKFNGNEESVSRTPDYTAKTITVSSTKGWAKTTQMTNLWQPESVTLSGAGVPSVAVDPEWRDDGSLASLSLTVDGREQKSDFGANGLLTAYSDSALGSGNLLSNHSFSSGVESVTINGTTVQQSLDGTYQHVSGQSMNVTRNVEKTGGGFEQMITPGGGASTVRRSNASGAQTAHDYIGNHDTGYGWYPGGLLAWKTLARGGNVTFGYSNGGARDLTSVTYPATTSPGMSFSAQTQSYGRNNDGTINSITDASGVRTVSYVNGRLEQSTYTSGALSGYKVTRTVDGGRPSGFVLRRSDTNEVIHSVSYGFNGGSDEVNTVISDGLSIGIGRVGNRITGINWGTVGQSWDRDGFGRIKKAGSNVTGSYAFDYRKADETETEADDVAEVDAQGRRKRCVTQGDAWTYQYGTAGQLSSASHPTLGTFAYTFDGIGRRTSYQVPGSSVLSTGNGLSDLNQFTSAEQSRVRKLQITAKPTAQVWINGSAVSGFSGETTWNVPDPGVNGGWVPWSVRAVVTGAGQAGANPDAIAEQKGSVWFPPANENFKYDDDGNRESSSQWDYGWDGANRLAQVRTRNLSTAPEGWDVTFEYDSEGRRFRKIAKRYEGGVFQEEKRTLYVWDGWDLVYERQERPNGTLLVERKYVWGDDLSGSHSGAGGAGGLLLIEERRGSNIQKYMPLYDGGGHVIGLAKPDGTLVAQYTWGPFGEVISTRGIMADANPMRWATKYFDAETGLYYFGHRYYDPRTGTWLNREPLGEDESVNLYAYCHNDPVNKVDVLGLAAEPIDGRIVNGQPKIVYVDWKYWWSFLTDGQTEEKLRTPTEEQLSRFFIQENGALRVASPGERESIWRERAYGAIPQEMENIRPLMEGMEKGTLAFPLLAFAPAAIGALSTAASGVTIEGAYAWGYVKLAGGSTALMSSPWGMSAAMGATTTGMLLLDGEDPGTAIGAGLGETFVGGVSSGGKMPSFNFSFRLSPRWNPLNYRVPLGQLNTGIPLPEYRPLVVNNAQRALLKVLEQRRLGSSYEQGGKLNPVEGIGGNRIQEAFGVKIQPATELGVDFVAPGQLGNIQLKGPFLNRSTLAPLTEAQQQAAMSSVLRRLQDNKAAGSFVIDVLGLSATNAASLRTAVQQLNLRTPVHFLE